MGAGHHHVDPYLSRGSPCRGRPDFWNSRRPLVTLANPSLRMPVAAAAARSSRVRRPENPFCHRLEPCEVRPSLVSHQICHGKVPDFLALCVAGCAESPLVCLGRVAHSGQIQGDHSLQAYHAPYRQACHALYRSHTLRVGRGRDRLGRSPPSRPCPSARSQGRVRSRRGRHDLHMQSHRTSSRNRSQAQRRCRSPHLGQDRRRSPCPCHGRQRMAARNRGHTACGPCTHRGSHHMGWPSWRRL